VISHRRDTWPAATVRDVCRGLVAVWQVSRAVTVALVTPWPVTITLDDGYRIPVPANRVPGLDDLERWIKVLRETDRELGPMPRAGR
jgi:hypothetical protein